MLNRRNFIFGLAGLAAVAVHGTTLAALAPSDGERLESALKTGLVEYQTFDLRGLGRGVELVGISSLVIRNCRFITDPGATAITVKDCDNVVVTCCVFGPAD